MDWWAVAVLWLVGAGALLEATASMLPRLGGPGARSGMGRRVALVMVGLLCLALAGFGAESAPVLPALIGPQ